MESEVSTSDQCLPHDLNKAEAYTKIFIGLLGQLFWVFNVRENEGQWWDAWRKYVEGREVIQKMRLRASQQEFYGNSIGTFYRTNIFIQISYRTGFLWEFYRGHYPFP